MKTLAILLALSAAQASASDEPTAPPMVAPENSCETSSDCAIGFVCAAGFCQAALAPAPHSLRRLGSRGGGDAEGFKYRGTVPDGFHLVSQPRWGLVGGGIAALGGGYLLAAAGGLASNAYLGLIPIAGPIFLAARWWSTGGWFDGFANFWVVLICAADVVVQVAGTVMLATGLGSPKRWLERDGARPRVTLVPGAGGAPLGASVVGRF